MPTGPRTRTALLALLVVLSVVQPGLAGAHGGGAGHGVAAGDATDADGGVGVSGRSAVNRHPSSAGATADALRTVRADAVHAEGLTGSDVQVGVIGRGFDATDDLSPHVADRRRAGDAQGATAHDTAVAEVVADTAPSADLYLAGVGRTPTPAEYAAAVDWLTARGVDVIVDSGSYFPSVAADERRITAAANRATDRGVVFVTSAGNYANRHWAGAGTADGWIEFADGDGANALAAGDRVAGRVTVRLRWRSDADYDLYLYRRLPDARDRVVAKSTGEESGPGLTVEGVDVAVPRGRYYVGVHADDPADAPGRVQVFAANHELEHATARGSMVAPATSDRVVAVGASADGERLPYSSLAETGDVDLTAPADAGAGRRNLTGTSAAAPFVAGTAALMESGDRDLSPTEVESILERTADDGGGELDALAAVEAARTDAADSRDGADAGGRAVDAGETRRGAVTAGASDAASEGDAELGRNATRTGERDDDGRSAGTDDDGRSAGTDDDGRSAGADDDGRSAGADDDREDGSDDRSGEQATDEGESGERGSDRDRRGDDAAPDDRRGDETTIDDRRSGGRAGA